MAELGNAGIDPMMLQLALLAGVGLTQLPKLQQGMRGGNGIGKKAGGSEAMNMEALAPFLQMLAAKQGAGGAAGLSPEMPEAPTPAVPRFPAPPLVSAGVSPAIPRVAPMDAS